MVQRQFLLVLLLLGSASAPTLGAAAEPPSNLSLGVSCISVPEPLCMEATLETYWADCYSSSPQWCTPHYTLTFTVPENQCVLVRLDNHDYHANCYQSAWTYVYEGILGPSAGAWSTSHVKADLCLGTLDVAAPQCAHWTHSSGPAPYDAEDPTYYSWYVGDAINPYWNMPPWSHPPVGFGAA